MSPTHEMALHERTRDWHEQRQQGPRGFLAIALSPWNDVDIVVIRLLWPTSRLVMPMRQSADLSTVEMVEPRAPSPDYAGCHGGMDSQHS